MAALALARAGAGQETADPWPTVGFVMLMWWLAWGVLRWQRIGSDQILLPVASFLSGLGLVEIYRLEPELGLKQAVWIGLGLLVLVGLCLLLRDHRKLERYRYVYLLAGVVLQVSVMVFGVEINGARLWFRFGDYQFQPVELVKILMILFLAAFLRRFRLWIRLGLRSPEGRLPRRALVLLGLGWALAEGVLIVQKDLGMALLFMGIFLTMFYIATGRTDLVATAGVLFVAGAWIGYMVFGHVQVRVQAWLDPFAHFQTGGYQMSQALFALSWGGLFGTGLGLGKPYLIPEAPTDFIFVALAEELGLVGALALLCAIALLVERGFRIALAAEDEFGTLLASGLAVLLAWQSLILIGGTLKLMPMTGITLPFVSYGGSSMVANFVVLALLLRIDRVRQT